MIEAYHHHSYISENPLCEAVKSKLITADPEAGIRVVTDEVAEARDAVYLTKSNAAYTRKKLLPVVREALAETLRKAS